MAVAEENITTVIIACIVVHNICEEAEKWAMVKNLEDCQSIKGSEGR